MKSAHKQEHVFQNGIYSGSKDNPFGFVNKSIWIDSRKTFTGISIHALLQLHTSNLGSAETSLRTNNYSRKTLDYKREDQRANLICESVTTATWIVSHVCGAVHNLQIKPMQTGRPLLNADAPELTFNFSCHSLLDLTSFLLSSARIYTGTGPIEKHTLPV